MSESVSVLILFWPSFIMAELEAGMRDLLHASEMGPHDKYAILKCLTKEAAAEHRRAYQSEWKARQQAKQQSKKNEFVAMLLKASGLEEEYNEK